MQTKVIETFINFFPFDFNKQFLHYLRKLFVDVTVVQILGCNKKITKGKKP